MARHPAERYFARIGPETFAKDLQLQLDFKPERLGAKRGDTVGLQLLCTPRAWNLIDREGLLEGLELPVGRGDASVLTNRVDFTVP